MYSNKNKIIILIIFIGVIVVSRGFFTDKPLEGHDSFAYYVTQHQFHQNIIEGVLLPRWAPDMRYGYGHPKLQYRPPILHYLAEPFYAITKNLSLSINIAIIISITIATIGAFYCCRLYMNKSIAMIGSIAYITFNYLLSDLYIRGAYYEVVAYAFIPWILWGTGIVFKQKNRKSPKNSISLTLFKINLPLLIYGCCWSLLICSHPQIMVFFIPLFLIHFFFLWNETRNNHATITLIVATFAGFLIAAPYWYVAIKELPYVRMELFYSGLESYNHHFISLKELFLESWPVQYNNYIYYDYLNRPRHLEMRTFNLWIIITLITLPILWLTKKNKNSRFLKRTTIFYISFIILITLTIPISRGVWYLFTSLHTFNFPWRALSITGICSALLLGLTIDEIRKRLKIDKAIFSISIIISILLLLFSWNKTKGWISNDSQAVKNIDSVTIQNHAGIPQQFYTPRWVTNYSTSPPNSLIRFIEGKGEAKILKKEVTEWEIEVDAYSDAKLAIAQYYYPGWIVKYMDITEYKHRAIEKARPKDGPLNPLVGLNISPLPNTGEISFNVPIGKNIFILKLTNTFNQILANIAFFVGVILLILQVGLIRSIRLRYFI